jgi:catechol 2,3-dioxygenase-like lactoylglutathione lyase family enzyme
VRRRRVISHVSLGARDLAASTALYDACLAPLGYARLYATERVSGYGPPGRDASLDLFQLGAGEVSTALPGFHLALEAPTRAAVDAFHRAALAAGATDTGLPGPRPRYGDGYYAAFVLDLDGHKLEAVHRPA